MNSLILSIGGLRPPFARMIAAALITVPALLAQEAPHAGSASFNLLILPKDPSGTLPEDYAIRAANLRLMSMERVQAILQREMKWPADGRDIRMIGIRGERPLRGGDPDALLDAVEAGSVALGYGLHHSVGLKVGDPIKLLGRTFTVARCEPARNKEDDCSAWIHLAEAQEMYGQKGRINGIAILNARAPSDQLGRIRAEIAELLPDTRVIELGGQTLARAEAREQQEGRTQPSTDSLWPTASIAAILFAVAGALTCLGFRTARRLRRR